VFVNVLSSVCVKDTRTSSRGGADGHFHRRLIQNLISEGDHMNWTEQTTTTRALQHHHSVTLTNWCVQASPGEQKENTRDQRLVWNLCVLSHVITWSDLHAVTLITEKTTSCMSAVRNTLKAASVCEDAAGWGVHLCRLYSLTPHFL